jgi:hypothetical protein
MGIGIPLIALASMAWGNCEDAQVLMVEAEQAVLEARLDDANEILGRLVDSFACGPIASPELLGQMWITEGVALWFGGDRGGAMESFAAASREVPDLWREEYGELLRKQYQQAAVIENEPGEIKLSPPLDTYWGAVDGRIVHFPIVASGGLHLVQAGPPGGPAEFGRIAFLSPQESLDLQTGLVEKESPGEVFDVEPVAEPKGQTLPEKKKAVPAFLLGAGAAGALAITSAVLAVSETKVMKTAETMETLDAAHTRQRVFGVSCLALTGVSATGVVLHFVL